MTLLFLGASAAFCVGKDKFQSNMLLESASGNKLLIDCGTDARHSLHAQGYTYTDINAVYISHLHADHAGGLEWLGISKRFLQGCKLPLYISNTLTKSLWDNVLSGGMSSIEDEEATLSSFFELNEVNGNSFRWEEYNFELIKMVHYCSNNIVMPSYGLLINNGRQTIFLTTDTRLYPELQELYERADLIFHDCETTEKHTGQHAHFNALKALDPEIKKKIWLYDYNDGPLPDAKKAGFKGFVESGQSFDF